MITIESNAVIGVRFNNQNINILVDTLSKKASSSVYITKEGSSRQVAMKSVIGLLSGNFKEGDSVKITVIGDNSDNINQDLKLVEELLKGDYE